MIHPALRVVAALAALLFASLAHAQAPLTVTPKSVKPGTTPALTLTTNGFFDLSRVDLSQIRIEPAGGISGMRVSNASERSVILSFDLAPTAAPGPRTLSMDANDVTVLIRFNVDRPPPRCTPQNCAAPSSCVNDVCTPRPTPVMCTSGNCRPPSFCEDNRCVRALECVPRCRSPKPFCDNGRCTANPT